ncbi:MAG: DUF3168 domain-containing protein [Parabacteroides gordonii]|nr:DUF3168 domain-containing protein [Parabacteroides gordonii]
MLPAENKFKIASVIRDLLLQDDSVKELVAYKIYPLYAPEKTVGDFVLFKRDEYSIDRTKMGVSGARYRIFVNAISEDYDRSQEIAERVYKALDEDYSDGMKIKLIDSTEDTIDKKYIQVLLFSIE